MEIKIKVLSGSRSGEEFSFDSEQVSLGRDPSTDIAFDAEKDLMVSANHANLVARGASWSLEDLGSSNGTWMEGEKVKQKTLRSGDVIQLGRNGPRLEVRFKSAIPATMLMTAPGGTVRPATDPGLIIPEGRTVAMMMQPGASTTSSAPPAASATAPPKKRSALGKVLIALAVVFVLLGIGLAGAVLVVRNKAREIKNVAQKALAAEAEKVKEASELRKKIRDQEAAVAEVQGAIEQAGPGGDGAELTDIQRQLQESQRMIDELTSQLQRKNDEISTVRSTAAANAQRSAQLMRRSAEKTPPPPPPPTPPPAAAPQVTPAVDTVAAAAVAGLPSNLTRTRVLKRKVNVIGLPPEVPPATLPSDTPKQLADLIARSLVATGRFVVENKGMAGVDVTVTNFVNVKRTNVNVKSASDAASKIGSLMGKNIPTTPVNVTSYTYDAALSARVRLFDRVGNDIQMIEPASQSRDTKSKVSLEPIGLKFGQVFGSDTPLGDVSRDVVGKAVDTIDSEIGKLEWSGMITTQRNNLVVLDCGRKCGIEIDDYFEVLDGSSVIGAVRVKSISENNADGELVSSSAKVQGKLIRYAGSAGPARPTARSKTIRMTKDAPGMSGPGNSFAKARDLKKGARFNFDYSVGIWARISEGSSSFWVPLTSAQIES